MRSNELCKKLNEESHKYATIPDSQRYSAHFDFNDLVKRLHKVKEEREEKSETRKKIKKSERSEKIINFESIIKKERFSNSALHIDLTNLKKTKEIPWSTKNIKSKKVLKNVYTERALKKNNEKILPKIHSSRIKISQRANITEKVNETPKITKVTSETKFRAYQSKRKSSII